MTDSTQILTAIGLLAFFVGALRLDSYLGTKADAKLASDLEEQANISRQALKSFVCESTGGCTIEKEMTSAAFYRNIMQSPVYAAVGEMEGDVGATMPAGRYDIHVVVTWTPSKDEQS